MRRTAVFLVLVVIVAVAVSGGHLVQSTANERDSSFTFREVSAEVGFEYNTSGRLKVGNTNAGIYVNDYNRDGWPDVLAIGGREPVLFENVGGEFERANALPAFEVTITSALFFDYDNDDRPDLLLLPLPGSGTDDSRPDDQPLLFENTGEGYEYAGAVNATLAGYPQGATTADYDGDGRLDVFVWQNGPWSDRTPVGYGDPGSVGNITDDNGVPNLLLHNTGDGFENVTEGAGIEGDRWSLAASFVDLTGDGRADIHVANDFNEDILYINQGDSTFRLVRMGDSTDRNGMSSEIADVNGDGRPDVFVTNIYYDSEGNPKYVGRALGNTLQINHGDGDFEEVARDYGVHKGGWGWAAVMADLDNDADHDLIHATNERNRMTSGGNQMYAPKATYPAVWEFASGTFVSKDASALGFEPQDGRGAATLDFDHDGDLDVLIADNKGGYHLYENQIAATDAGLLSDGGGSERALEILVRGKHTYLAHGATVKVVTGNTTQYRFVTSQTDYNSQGSSTLHVGLGPHTTADTVVITWDTGTVTKLNDVRAGQRIVVHPNGTVRSNPLDGPPAGPLTWLLRQLPAETKPAV